MGLLATEGLSGFDSSLELVQELDESTEASNKGEFDVLHEQIKDKIESDKPVDLTEDTTQVTSDEPPVEAPQEVEEEPVEESSDEVSTDTEVKEDSEELDGKRTSVVAESLRGEYYTRLAVEAFELSNVPVLGIGSQAVSVVGGYAYQKIRELASVLKYLGIEYGPTALRMIKKGVVYLFVRLIKTALQAVVSTSTFVKRYRQSISKIEADIRSMREIIETLKTKEKPSDLTDKVFYDKSVLSWLCVSERPNPEQAVKVMSDFMTDTITYVDRGVEADIRTLQKLIELSQTQIRGNIIGMMNIPPVPGTSPYRLSQAPQEHAELVETRVYNHALPDRLRFVTTLPKTSVRDEESLIAAYQASGMYLTVDAAIHQNLEGIDYMDIQGVERLLDSMESLCDLSKRHLSFYGKVEKSASALKFGYRHYYQKLTESKEAATLRSSLIEYVYLKQSFITRVYLPTVMDIHDLSTSFMIRVSKYLKENLKALA